MASVYKQILDAVRLGCQSLVLEGVDPANVIIHKVPSDRQEYLPKVLPAIIVAPLGRPTLSPTEGTNEKDVIRYPVMVALIQKSTVLASGSAPQSENLDRMLEWHEKSRRLFIHQNLTGVSTEPYCTVEPGDTFNPAAFGKGLDAGGMVLRFRSEETRGTN